LRKTPRFLKNRGFFGKSFAPYLISGIAMGGVKNNDD